MSLKTGNAVLDKSKVFAIRIVRLYKYLTTEAGEREFVMSKQLLRNGTSVGANVRESRRAQSSKDFITKLYVSLKEADETAYWLELMKETDYLTPDMFESLYLIVKSC